MASLVNKVHLHQTLAQIKAWVAKDGEEEGLETEERSGERLEDDEKSAERLEAGFRELETVYRY